MLSCSASGDFIINANNFCVFCLTNGGESFKVDVEKKDNLNALSKAIKEVISIAEKRSFGRLKSGTFLFDFEPLSKHTIALPKKFENVTNLELKFYLESKLGVKILSVCKSPSGVFEVISSKKAAIEGILNMINGAEIEVLNALPTLEFIGKKAFENRLENDDKSCLIKFNDKYCEAALFNREGICGYECIESFGIFNILHDLCGQFDIKPKILKVILENYRTISKVDRMKKYSERAHLDFYIKELIENTALLSSIHSEVKNKLLNLKQAVIDIFKLDIKNKICFFYEPQFAALKLHEFMGSEESYFELKVVNKRAKEDGINQSSLLKELLTQVKFFFNLNS